MMRALLIFALLLSGCVTHPSGDIVKSQLVGRFANGDSFWPRWLELKSDGSFLYMQLTDVINEKGEFEGSWGFDGTWNFHAPDRIELTPKSGSNKVTVFVRLSKRGEHAILESELFSDILSTWVDGGGVRYLKKEPNQSSQRNAMAWPFSLFESRSSRG
jgi:hypothetical protein